METNEKPQNEIQRMMAINAPRRSVMGCSIIQKSGKKQA
jgi:hypothetical protein